ncbi:MAG: type IV pilus assembly protein PilM [Actinomycetota bacterium]|nr:type IV pilus assembly protein PilM [Actinomycetota bacterium]
MATRLVALDLGSFAVRAAELSVNGGEPVLQRFAQVGLPPGAMRDGEVADPPAVSAAVRRLWSEGGFRAKRVVVGIGNERVIVRQAEFPTMSEDDLRAALRFEGQELIPIPIDEAILDFQILEEVVGTEGDPRMRVLLAAAERETVRSHLAAVEGAGLRASAVDVIPFALVRILTTGSYAPAFDADGSAEAIVCVGGGVTNVVVHSGGIPQLVRVIPFAGDDITESIAEQLDVDLDRAEDLKRRADPASVFPSVTGAARVVDDRSDSLVEEIRGSLEYYLGQAQSAPIGRILLTGGASRTVGLVEKLRGHFGERVECAHPLADLRVARSTSLTEDELAELEPLLAVPLGLALAGTRQRGGRRISLLPAEVAVVERQRRQTGLAAAGLAGLASLLVLLWAAKASQVSKEQDRGEKAEQRNAELRREEAALTDVVALGADVAARQGQVRAVLADDVAWPRLFQEVATVIPSDVWLTSFTGQKGSPGTVTFNAKGFDHTSTARWLLRVGELKSVSGTWVPTSAKSAQGGPGVVTFTSTGNLTDQARSQRIERVAGQGG